MPKNEKNNIPRHHFVPQLAKIFIAEYRACVLSYKQEQQLELTEHLLVMLDCIKQSTQNDTTTHYQEFVTKEDELLKKYGKLLKPYKTQHFEKYFAADIILTEKDIISTEEFNSLPSNEQSLTPAEVTHFVQVCSNVLQTERQLLLLEQEPSFNVKELVFTVKKDTEQDTNLPFNVNEDNVKDKELTKSRQLLAVHFLLQSGFGIEPRSSVSVSAITRFAHLLMGVPFTTLQKSDIYKKYRLMPNLKKGKELINDLRFIRSYFAELNIVAALKLIDDEINREINELPHHTKRQFLQQEKGN